MPLLEQLSQRKADDETSSLPPSPNSYRRKTGRCPKGFVGDAKGRCMRTRKFKQRLFGKVRHRGRKRKTRSKHATLTDRLRKLVDAQETPPLSTCFVATNKHWYGTASKNAVDYDLLDNDQHVLLSWWIEPTLLPAPTEPLLGNSAIAAWLDGSPEAYYVNVSWSAKLGKLRIPAKRKSVGGQQAYVYEKDLTATQFKRVLPKLQRAWKAADKIKVKSLQKETKPHAT